MSKHNLFLEKTDMYVKNNIKRIVSYLILLYYHNYKEDKDFLEQIYNSVMDFFILSKKIKDELLIEIIWKLENDYFIK